MNEDNIWRARTIVSRREIIYSPESQPPHLIKWLVKQRNGSWSEVWRTLLSNGRLIWGCSAIDEKMVSKLVNGRVVRSKKVWGCSLHRNGTDVSKPYCSHTLAAKYWLAEKQNDTRNQRESLQKH